MIGYDNLITNFTGTFWLPNYPELIFDGKVEDGELFLETTDNKFLEQSYLIRHSQNLLFHSKSNFNQYITLQVSLTKLHDSNPNLISVTFNILLVLYGKLFNTVEDIKFNGIIVNFTNINKWVSSHLITYSKIAKDRLIIEIDINDDYTLSFLKKRSIRQRDNFTVDNFYNVYVKLVSKKSDKSLHEWFEIKQTIQDFLNFVITEKNVLVYSLYGINENDSEEKEIDIQFKSFVTDEMNKCKNRKPTLLRFDLNEDKIQKFLKNWFNFKENKVIYSFYFNYMYETTTFELRVFKLVSFFKSFHQAYVFNKKKSSIYKEKVDRKDRILDKLANIELDSFDKYYLTSIICDTRLSLKERFMELIEPFARSVYVLNPIYSYVNTEELKEIDLGIDGKLKNSLINIIIRKKQIDSVDSEVERDKKYQELIDEINSDHKIKLNFLLLSTHIAINNLSGTLRDYRNIIGHSKNKHSEIHSYKWLFMAKILEFISQIWILRIVFELKIKEIEEIYFLEEAAPINVIIESNIQEYNHKSIH